MRITFSTVLTIFRIILIPFVAYAMVQRWWVTALLLFSVAAITDLFDGYLARKWQDETKLGAYLDPLADKLLITVCYGALVFAPVEGLHIPTWFLAIVMAKEAALLVGALYWGLLKHEVEVKPSLLGKAAMAFQSGLIGWVIICSIFHWVPLKTFYGVLAAALLLVVGSLVHYAYSFMYDQGNCHE